MAACLKRLGKELKDLEKNPSEEFEAKPVKDDDLMKWTASLKGPKGSPYEEGVFELDIEFSDTYPMDPPEIKFKTKIYHPNIASDGDICLDILSDKWSPALMLSKVLLSISSLLTDPNPDDPLEGDIAEEYLENRSKFNKNAKEWTRKYAPDHSKKRKNDDNDDQGSKKQKGADNNNNNNDDDVQIVNPKTSSSSTTTAATPIDLTGNASTSSNSTTTAAKPMCKYGKGCYRKNPQHLQEFNHPE